MAVSHGCVMLMGVLKLAGVMCRSVGEVSCKMWVKSKKCFFVSA